MTMLVARMRNRLDSTPVNRLSRYAGPTPNRSGTDLEVEAWFSMMIRACQREIQCQLYDKNWTDSDEDRSHIALIYKEIDELQEERNDWRKYYKA